MKWEDQPITFINVLRFIPGRNGVSLSYEYHDNEIGLRLNPELDFLENYILRISPIEEAFNIDASEVDTYLFNFLAGNEAAKSIFLITLYYCIATIFYFTCKLSTYSWKGGVNTRVLYLEPQ